MNDSKSDWICSRCLNPGKPGKTSCGGCHEPFCVECENGTAHPGYHECRRCAADGCENPIPPLEPSTPAPFTVYCAGCESAQDQPKHSAFSHAPFWHSEASPSLLERIKALRALAPEFRESTEWQDIRRTLWKARADAVTDGIHRGNRVRFDCSDYVRHADGPGLSVWRDRPPTLGGDESYSSQNNDEDGRYFVPDYLGFSDYSGSIVERANLRAFCQEFGEWDGLDETAEPVPEFCVELYGGHGTRALAIHIRSAPAAAWEFLRALEDYPLANEELHSEMETQGADAAWESWARADYERALESEYPQWELDDADPAELRQLFETSRETANEYWECETGGDMWIRLDRVVEATDLAELESLKGIKRVSACQSDADANRALAHSMQLAEQARACAIDTQRAELQREARGALLEFCLYASASDKYVPHFETVNRELVD